MKPGAARLIHFLTLFLPLCLAGDVAGQKIKSTADLKDDSAKSRFEKNIAQYRSQRNTDSFMNALLQYGLYKQEHSDFRKAAGFFNQVYHMSNASQQAAWKGRAALQLGHLNFIQARNDSCLYFYHQAISIGEQLQDDSLLSAAYQGMGSFYKTKKKFPQAYQFLDKGIAYAKKSKIPLLVVRAVGNKAMTYSWQERPAEAIALHQQILPVAEKAKNYHVLGNIHMNMAASYAMQNDAPNTLKYLDLLQDDLRHNTDNRTFQCEVLMVSGFLYLNINRPALAEKYILQALPIAKALNYKSFLNRGYDSLSVIKSLQGDFRKALAYYKLARLYKDSISGEKMQIAAQELEVKFHTAQKEKELSLQELQITKKDLELQKTKQYNLYSISTALVALLMAGLVYANFRHKKTLHRRELQSFQKERELHVLQALMQGEEKERSRIAKDLHDGVSGILAAVKMHFSSLTAQNIAIQDADGYKQGIKLLDEAAHEVRKTSHNLMPEVLLQYGLDKALARYCASISNASALMIQYDSIGRINRFIESFELSVYRIVQELLNNIVKHSKATEAIVQMSRQHEILAITIEDNGVGFSSKNIATDGMGLSSLRSRIKAINGRIEISSEDGNGVSVYLEFDVTGLKKESEREYE